MKRHLIVGASGTVASGVVRALVQRGETVHALTSQAQRAGTREGVTWIHADVASGAGVREAFEGIDRAFLFAPPGYVPQDRVLAPLIDEAQRHELEKVVLMTAMGANADESAPLRQAELRLERSGLAWNIVRPNWFMQNFNTSFLSPILEQGKILLPAGAAKVSFIDAGDISATVARLLVADDVDNRDFDLTGSEALDHAEVAAILSRVTGRAIRYEEISPEAMSTALLAAGLPKDYTAFLILIFGFLKAGYNERLTDNVEKLLGRKPTSFERYALGHKQAWATVRAA
jgi:uncharacterized protein YbjT (DUF2867 family)